MNEYHWAEQFERQLNAVMGTRKKPVRKNYPIQLGAALEAAQICLTTDFAAESQVRAELLGNLLAKIERCGSERPADRDENLSDGTDQELAELDLSEVVGGVAGSAAGACTLCGCTRSSSAIQEERCPECGHARSLHR